MFEILKLLVQCVALAVIKNSRAHDDHIAKVAASELGDVARVGNHMFFTDKGIVRILAISRAKTSQVVFKRSRMVTVYVFHGNRHTQASESYASQSFASAAAAANRRAAIAMFEKLDIRLSALSK
jgi:hypothetical protein